MNAENTPRGALTLAVLMAAVAELPPAPPRIIVGMPDVGENECYEMTEPHRLVLLGNVAYEKLKAHAKPYDRETDPFGLTFGIEIEPWGSRNDHFELWALFRSAVAPATPVTEEGKNG